jgi:hypothetical protein
VALLAPTNCTFDVYRGFSPANPYAPPVIPGAYCGLTGIVKQHVRNGRFGWFGGVQANALLHWTTVLLVPITDDIRDAYATQLSADPIAAGDTVMMHDYPFAPTCTAFVVVAVQRVDRSGPGDYLRVYLDRARPSYGGACPDCTASGYQCEPCPGITLPSTLYATLTVSLGAFATDCECFPTSQTIPVTFNGGYWTGTASFGSCDWTITVNVFCITTNAFGIAIVMPPGFEQPCSFGSSEMFIDSYGCSPLNVVAVWGGTSQLCPCPNATLTITVTA